jgi:hypothetical protein
MQYNIFMKLRNKDKHTLYMHVSGQYIHINVCMYIYIYMYIMKKQKNDEDRIKDHGPFLVQCLFCPWCFARSRTACPWIWNSFSRRDSS